MQRPGRFAADHPSRTAWVIRVIRSVGIVGRPLGPADKRHAG